jgi:N-acetylmuramoyl-L-alanine amidase
MIGMLNPGKALGCVLAAGLLAGCAAAPHRNSGHALDWQSEELASAPPAHSVPAVQPPVQLPPPKPPPANHFSETWTPLNRWCKANRVTGPTCLTMAPLPTYELQTTNGVFRLHAGSQLAQWNGLELRLGFAPQLIDNQPFVHTLDLQKSIQPLLLGNSSAFFKPASQTPEFSLTPVIVIDPGHGGENSGTRSVLGDHFEKEFTLDWAMRLERLLSTNGWHVFLTRRNDMEVALSNRVMIADNHKADLFLSLHFNSAAPDEHQSGLETYCLTPSGMPSTVTREFADDTSLVFPNNAYDEQNLDLALRVHRALLQVNGNHDRGIRRARFPGVLRGQRRPAILVEGGYLSNPHEAALIADPDYREKLAEAVAQAISAPTHTTSIARDSASGPEVGPGGQSTATDSVLSVPWEE